MIAFIDKRCVNFAVGHWNNMMKNRVWV